MEEMNVKSVTIAVLTYNSESTIHQCLSALSQLDYPRQQVQILVLDNGSTDRTAEMVEAMQIPAHSFPHLNLGQLRNKALSMAAGEIIAFVDSDCVVERDWLRQIVKWFDEPSVAIAGNEYLLPDDASVFERNWYPRSNYGIKENDLIPAGNMAISKAVAQSLGGFDESLITGEDAQILQLVRTSGYRTISDHQIRCVHLGNAKNLKEYFRKETWYGLGMLGTVKAGTLDKPFIISHLYLILVAAMILGAVALILWPGPLALTISALSAAGLVGIPIASALERIYMKKRKGNLLYVSLAFSVFFLARINALFYIYGLKQYVRK